MEALAGLAIACNVIQVISFCHETVEVGVQIHKRGNVDEDLSLNARRLEDLSKQLDVSIQSTAQAATTGPNVSASYQDLSSIARDCSLKAKEMSVELDKVSNSKGGSVVKACKTLWKKSKLEKIEKVMQQYQKVLNSRLPVELL
jgi:hypothetical protein